MSRTLTGTARVYAFFATRLEKAGFPYDYQIFDELQFLFTE